MPTRYWMPKNLKQDHILTVTLIKLILVPSNLKENIYELTFNILIIFIKY